MSVELTCQKCTKKYTVLNYRREISKYCSAKCHNIVAGTLGGKAGKGISRGVGIKRPYMIARNKIFKVTGERCGLWKGDKVGYISLHLWVYRQKGKAKQCTNLNCPNLSKNFQWANLDKEYTRDLSKWKELCAPCHYEHDQTLKSKPFPFSRENRNIRLNP